MYRKVDCKIQSDVPAFGVRTVAGEVHVEVHDEFDGAGLQPVLITARLQPSDAIKLARALLAAAGVGGVRDGNRVRYTFID